MLEINKVLTISSAYISSATAALLDADAFNSLCVFDKSNHYHYYGWYIYCDTYIPDDEDIPEDLVTCIEYALKNDCGILCLDCDGAVVEDLPVFEEEELL